MYTLKSSLVTIGQVFGLVFGSNFTRPADRMLDSYWHFQSHL